MTSSWRLLCLSVCCAAALGTSCFGGPTSDWPKGADSNDDGDDTPRPGGSKKDAGSASGSNLDAGLSVPVVCTPASDAGTADAGDAELERPSGSLDGGILFAAPRPAADAGDPWATPEIAPYDDEDCPR